MRRKIGFALLTLIVVFAAFYFTFVYTWLFIPERKQLPHQPALATAIAYKVADILAAGSTVYLAVTTDTIIECGNIGSVETGETPLAYKWGVWKSVSRNPYFIPQQGFKQVYTIAGKKVIAGNFMQYDGTNNGVFRIQNSDKELTSFEIDGLYALEFNDMSDDTVTVIVRDFKVNKELAKIVFTRNNNGWTTW